MSADHRPEAGPGPLVRQNEVMAPWTTLQLGGPASTVFELKDPTQIGDLDDIVHIGAAGCPAHPVVLGGGSNVLVADAGVTDPVVLVRSRGVTYRPGNGEGQVLVTAEAGHPWGDLLEELTGEGLAGMELMTGIPGTVGAMPVQNVGAYGQETADVLVSARAWDWESRRVVRMDARECRLGHRTSRFKRSRRWLILDVTFRLIRDSLSQPLTYRQVAEVLDARLGTRHPIGEVMAAVRSVRAEKGMLWSGAGPLALRTVGSVFLSPTVDRTHAGVLRGRGAPVHDFPDGSIRVSASWLMREAGLRLGQHLIPGVRVSPRHFTLVAEDGATTAAFIAATAQVQEQVAQATGVWLTPEPDPIGDLPDYQMLTDRAGSAARPPAAPRSS